MSEATFLQAILAAPDDDDLRLAYADWLDRRGDVQGEFIRLQCVHANKWNEAISVFGDNDCKRMDRLEKENRDRWLRDMPKLAGIRWCLWRGLAGWIQVPEAEVFHKNAYHLFLAGPVEYLTFQKLSLKGAIALAQSPYLERIRILDLAYGAMQEIEALKALLASPSIAKLKTLRLFHGDIGDAVAIALAECPHLQNLKLLTLYSSHIDDPGALAIARSPHLRNVGFIDLSRNSFGDEARLELEKNFNRRINI